MGDGMDELMILRTFAALITTVSRPLHSWLPT